jgi:hypothetical protein
MRSIAHSTSSLTHRSTSAALQQLPRQRISQNVHIACCLWHRRLRHTHHQILNITTDPAPIMLAIRLANKQLWQSPRNPTNSHACPALHAGVGCLCMFPLECCCIFTGSCCIAHSTRTLTHRSTSAALQQLPRQSISQNVHITCCLPPPPTVPYPSPHPTSLHRRCSHLLVIRLADKQP